MDTTWVSKQLKVKDEQINHLNGLLVESNERLKESSTRLNESHVIIQTLQAKIPALPEPKEEKEKEEKANYSQGILIFISAVIGGLLAFKAKSDENRNSLIVLVWKKTKCYKITA